MQGDFPIWNGFDTRGKLREARPWLRPPVERPSSAHLSPSPAPLFNRNTTETGIAVTPTKLRTVVLSNRNKMTPPGGVASWLLFRPALRISTRYTLRIEIAVTPTKQTTEAISTRYKKPSPREGTTLSLGPGLSPLGRHFAHSVSCAKGPRSGAMNDGLIDGRDDRGNRIQVGAGDGVPLSGGGH